MSIENPYFHRGPVRNPGHFFGRTQEVTSVLSLIKNSQSVSIVGPRRIGKSSFLLHISHPTVMAQHNLSPDDHTFVFIDCEGLNNLDQAGFYRLILEETEDQLSDRGIEIELRIPETLTYRQFERALRQLNRQGLRLIYCFDEFELLSENHNLDADFFSGLRGLTARYEISYVTASQDHLLELSYAEGVLGSPFFNIFAVQRLGLLNQAEADQLIHEPAQAAGLPFSEALAGFILELVGPHPLFLNIACFHAFAWRQRIAATPAGGDADNEDDIAAARYRQIQPQVLAELEGHLRYYWSKLDEQEREALATLDQVGKGETTQVLLHRLEQRGLIVRDNGGYHYLSTALADFVARHIIEKNWQVTPPELSAALIGRRLGPYVITGQIGRGGMARVYKGRHQTLQRDVAIKILFTHLANNDEFLARFRREAQAVAALRHSHIVQVYDFGVQGEMYYMVMEYVTGGSLMDRLADLTSAGERLSLAEIARLVREVASALDYAHAQGIVHRDLKPANIMLTAEGQAVLADFGLARLMSDTRHTATGATFGTPAYMSPEQAQGDRGDERSDTYTLGVILYELVTGQLPFGADTPFGMLMMHLNEPVPPPRMGNPQLPEAVEPVILKAMAKAPQARYQTAGELAQALSRAVAGGVQNSTNPMISAAVS